MEENIHPESSTKRILITGPESTGKSDLALELAKNYGGTCVPEYARDYIGALTRPYEYIDIEHIAHHQAKEYMKADQTRDWLFFDTWLVITKVWFEVVYGRYPNWMDKKIRSANFDLVLICDTDLPWVPDPVRENGGQMREELMEIYKKEMNNYGFKWALVSGIGIKRLERAIYLINKNISHGKS